MIRLILLDRDGVVNEDSAEFVKTAAEFKPIKGAIEAMAHLHQAGFQVGICTNQSGIGRGLLNEVELQNIHTKLATLLEAAGGALAGLAHCPHLPDDGCVCRKPRPGMLNSLMRQLDIGPAETLFVGDSPRDIEAALAAGCGPVLVRTGNGSTTEPHARSLGVTEIYDDLGAFAKAQVERRQRQLAAQQ